MPGRPKNYRYATEVTCSHVDGAGDGLSSILDRLDDEMILHRVGLVVERPQQVDDPAVRVDRKLVGLGTGLARQLVRDRVVHV